MRRTTKLVVSNGLITLVVLLLFAWYSLELYYEEDLRAQHKSLETCIRTFWELLGHKGAEFSIVDGRLLVGGHVVSGDPEVPDKVQEIFGGVATIFMGDIRVSTNVLDDKGKRAVGTRLVGPAYSAIVTKGRPYRGEATILGHPYLTAYDPIRDRKGFIIGAIFVGVEKSSFQEQFSHVKSPILIVLAGLLACLAVVIFLLLQIAWRFEDTAVDALNFLRTLMDTIPSPIFYKDTKGRYLGLNKAYESYVRLPREDIIGKTGYDLWPKDLASRYEEMDLALFKFPGTQRYESSVAYHDGIRRDVIFHKATFRAGDGAVAGLVGIILDITERKQAHDSHVKTNRQLQLILDAAGEGIYGVDLQGNVTFINPAAAQMVGWHQEELLGKNQHSLIHHTKADHTSYPVEDCPIHAAVRSGKVHEGKDELYWRKDGTSFQVEYISTPLRENGELVGAVVIFKDTTERHLAEEQLLKLSQAVMQSPISVLITDAAGKIEFVNPIFTKMSGYEAEEVVGRSLRLLMDGKTPSEVYRSILGTVTAGRVWTGEIFNRKKNGETHWEHATVSPIRNSAGAISHYMSSMENMTERKTLEEQLRQAQKMETVGQLAGGIAHDFNNILTVIMGFGHLLHASLPPGDPNRNNIAQIISAADRAAHLTKSLLAISRKQAMQLQQVEMNELTRNHTEFLARILGGDVALKIVLTGEPLFVTADGGQIEQVIMNLAINARDAMPGGGELVIRTSLVQLEREFNTEHGCGMPGRYALITLSDTGTGMDEATRKKIFEPFFTTKARGHGTGLGLAIVYGIVKQHGGHITILSERGSGTTFSIYLPLTAEKGEVPVKPAALVPHGGKETILVIEDDPVVRSLMESLLKGFGYCVISTDNGSDALELFKTKWQEIDLALIDVIMPKMNGKQVCELLRKRSPHLKVLFQSGYAADLIRDRGILVEGVDLIMKPSKPDELARKVREMLDAA